MIRSSVFKQILKLVKEHLFKSGYEDWWDYLTRMLTGLLISLCHLISLLLPPAIWGGLKGLLISAFLFSLYAFFAFNAEITFVLAIAATLFFLLAPAIHAVKVSSAATNTVAQIAKECAVKEAQGELDPKFNKNFDRRIFNHYTFLPADRNCNGDENNSITAQSKNIEKFPTYSYNVKTGVKTCSHDGPKEELFHCNARRNGEW